MRHETHALQEKLQSVAERYNSRVRQPMRHVMALRVSKAVLVFAIALFYTILVLNNITDYGSNYEFVRHVPGTYGLLHRHHRLGISHYASMLVGWCAVAEIVSWG